MNDDVKMQEQLSALADGQLQGEEFAQAVACAQTGEGLATWQMYHLVGDVLRSSELAQPAAPEFLGRLREALAQEPQPALLPSEDRVQVADVVSAQASVANASLFHWKLAAGFASLAAVAAIGWHAYTTEGVGSGPQLAVVPAQGPVLATADNGGGQSSVMIRDPRLDELLAAHRQFGGASNLQMPAGFLRNATFEAPQR